MPARLDKAAAARSVISRAEQFVARWPAGYGRTLWQRVVIIQDEPADLALGLWFACAGAQVQVCCGDAAPWVRERDDALMAGLLQTIDSREPRLMGEPLRGLQHDNYHRRWGFAYLEGSDEAIGQQVEGPVEVVLIDGLTRLSRDPAGLLKLIHDRTQWSSSIEILPREDDEDAPAKLDKIRQAAIAIGFGERPASTGESPGLSLVRLAGPMSDHPVLDDATIMAHCAARLDIAAALAKGRAILDAGGWAGLGAQRFLEAGAERVVNLDISAEALALGRSRLGDEDRVEFVQWDLNQAPLPFDDGAFDLVVCLEALEHIREQRQAVGEFFRVLQPGGLLLISVPDYEYENTWARLNQHGNAFHLHVPTRSEFEQLLGDFDAIRWLRQTDVSGSFVFEEQPQQSPASGRFAISAQWDVKAAGPQVIMALCTKGSPKGSKSKQRTPAITSDLHVYTSQSDQIARIREGEAAYKLVIARERFEWWTRVNVLDAQLRGLTSDVAAARRESEQWRGRVQTDEQIAALQTRFDRTQQAIEAITAELTQARAERQQESKRWVDEVHYQARVLNETQRQRYEASQELSEANQRLAEATQRAVNQAGRLEQVQEELRQAREKIEHLTTQSADRQAALAAAQALLAEARSERESDRSRANAELIARVERARETLVSRIERLLEQSMEQVDRRCLMVEGKVYDLEDELDRPAVSPNRNGSPPT